MTPRGKRSQPSSSPVTAQSSSKKPRRSQRLRDNEASPKTASPDSKHVEADRTPASSPAPGDTQVASQYHAPPPEQDYEDANDETIWGYLLALNETDPEKSVLKLNKSSKCESEARRKGKNKSKASAGGFLIGRHPECDLQVDSAVISNRHCVIYKEIADGKPKAVLEDLSQNGTWVNRIIVGRNNRRDLATGDEIELAGGLQYVFRYPKRMHSTGFKESYDLGRTLGSGHFAVVHIAVDKKTGAEFAVKIFKNKSGSGMEGLQQEIAVLMSVSHPNVLCLRATYEETDGIYLVLELAKEGELFNYIIQNTKLSEDETRHIYKQLLNGLKYLHERNIVHRDIKPENILLCDKQLTVKLADFGLAKIIGEDSFTHTLCGTPSYVAPEILENSRTRKYSRAVDMWSLGVVLYICLCGFPPFSDELNTPENPYNLSQQIKMGRFDFPSPYWDSVGDPALDLIERMLDVNSESRITVEEALKHPWITGQTLGVADSCDSLTAGMQNIGFTRKRVAHERTLLAEAPDLISELKSSPIKNPPTGEEKNGKDEKKNGGKDEETETKNEVRDGTRPENTEAGTKAFMNIGGRGGDGTLYDDSYYQVSQVDLESSS